jgi:hypothetical protein
MEQSREGIIDLIQKLLNLSKSDNENEASLSLSRAQALLEKHNLSLADLQARADTPYSPNMINLGVPLGNAQWKIHLTNHLAEMNFCTCVLTGKETHVLGRQENVYATLVMAGWLIPQFENIAYIESLTCPDYIPKLKWRNSFLWGMLNRVVQRLQEDRRVRLNSSQNLTALVASLGTELEVYKVREYPRLRKGTSYTTPLFGGAYQSGKIAGDRVSLYGSNVQLNEGQKLLS